MQHNENTENLALLYAYGEMAQNERQDFERHLQSCAKCKAIIKTCAATSAALPQIEAPAFRLPQQQERKNIWDYITSLFSVKRLAPAGALLALIAFLAVAVYQYGAHNAAADYFADNMYAQLNDIEQDIDDIYADFEFL